MASWLGLPSLKGMVDGAAYAASFLDPRAYRGSPPSPDPSRMLVPHEQRPEDAGMGEGGTAGLWTPLAVGQTACSLRVAQARVVSTKRDGNCLYRSMIKCIATYQAAGKAFALSRAEVVGEMGGLDESGQLEAIENFRKATSEYIKQRCVAEEEEGVEEQSALISTVDPKLTELLDATITGYNLKVEESYQQNQKSLAAMASFASQEEISQASAQIEEKKLLDTIPKGPSESDKLVGYGMYSDKVLQDKFWGGYVEVYALSKLLGIEIQVYSDVESQAASEEASLDPASTHRIHAFTASSYSEETAEEEKIIFYVRFDPAASHFDVLDITHPE